MLKPMSLDEACKRQKPCTSCRKENPTLSWLPAAPSKTPNPYSTYLTVPVHGYGASASNVCPLKRP